jgi:mono/diheme cytochrome c family protein
MRSGLLRFHRFRVAVPILGLVLSLAWLSGCDDTYSDAIVYTVRTDPLFTKALPGNEQPFPDRPGQLPLFVFADVEDSRNPLHDIADKFLKDGTIRDPSQLKDKDREELEKVLDKIFGTPAEPQVASSILTPAARDVLQLSKKKLVEGSRLYRLHCLQCHGVTGDGRGPIAKWVNPHPRDYRQGLFKFVSVDQEKSSKPSRADLVRVIRDGVEGTAMPAHNLLPAEELELLSSYVIHLSLRGQAEYDTLTLAFTEKMELNKEVAPKGIASFVFGDLRGESGGPPGLIEQWVTAQSAPIQVQEYPRKYLEGPKYEEELEQSIKRGQGLFLAAEKGKEAASCVSCHKDYGRQSLFRYDVWGTLVRPANVTAGVYRGGRRPIDLYWRIHAGINPSTMPPLGVGPTGLKGDQIWDLVNFLQVLPYPAMREKYKVELDAPVVH